MAVAGVLDPLATEFQVNSHTQLGQRQAMAAVDADGDFVVAWRSFRDGYYYGVFARRFDRSGAALAVEFQVNTHTIGSQSGPDLAGDANGDFVVVWSSGNQDGSQAGIFARRFASDGTPQATDFQVNSYTTSSQAAPVVARDVDGDFVVAWVSSAQDGSGGGVFARRFASNGAPQAIEFHVNVYTTGSQISPDVAIDADGDFVVAWQSSNQDGSERGIFGRRFDALGVAQATEFQVNSYTTGAQISPAVAINADGDFVVVWQRLQVVAGDDVFARRYDASGTPLAAEFRVNTYSEYLQTPPRVALDADGDFVVLWRSRGGDPDLDGMFARRFLSSGVAQGAGFQVNSYTPGFQFEGALGLDPDGDLIVVWTSAGGQDGSSYGVFGRRFTGPPTLDVDGDGEFAALTDGLVVLRYVFGYSGGELISGAVGLQCSRCTAETVTAYLDNVKPLLDIDDDGQVAPLTDALLVLRHGFGFSGEALVSGAVDEDCGRCEAGPITAYLEGLST
jgi:hypothetical protein